MPNHLLGLTHDIYEQTNSYTVNTKLDSALHIESTEYITQDDELNR